MIGLGRNKFPTDEDIYYEPIWDAAGQTFAQISKTC
jgi:hypothetical protein